MSRTPNDDRSDSMNPNNDAYWASADNHSNQLNPNNSAYYASREHENDDDITTTYMPSTMIFQERTKTQNGVEESVEKGTTFSITISEEHIESQRKFFESMLRRLKN